MSGKNPFLGLGLGSPFLSFVRAVSNRINCSTLPGDAYLDVSSAGPWSGSNTTTELGVGTYETTPRGVFVSNDGLHLYTVGQSGDGVDQWDLSTAHDLSTAVHKTFRSVSSQELIVEDIFFKPDGTSFYIVGDFYDDIFQYNLGIPWDISTASYFGKNETGGSSTVQSPTGLTFSSDGVYAFVFSSYLRYMNRYTLSTPWNILSAYLTQNQSSPWNSQITSTGQDVGIAINPDGTRLVIIHSQGDEIEEYILSTPYYIAANVLHNGNLSVSSDTTFPTGCCWAGDGRYFYVLGGTIVFRYETCADGDYKIKGRGLN